MQYSFDKKLVKNNWTIAVDSAAKYGYFEHDLEGDGGGLWFEEEADSTQLHLMDYDGVYALPASVKDALIELGFVVSEDFN